MAVWLPPLGNLQAVEKAQIGDGGLPLAMCILATTGPITHQWHAACCKVPRRTHIGIKLQQALVFDQPIAVHGLQAHFLTSPNQYIYSEGICQRLNSLLQFITEFTKMALRLSKSREKGRRVCMWH